MDNKKFELIKNENDHLREEQMEMFKKLKKLNIKLEESEAFKSHFLSNISNEIVNPFTSILGISQNILKLGPTDIDQIHSMAKLIHSEAFDLDFQLRNIFAAAKIESGNNTLELINLKIEPFIEEIINTHRLKTEKKTLYFDIEYSFSKDYIITDADKLRMILINLIMNAINFSNEKELIKIYAEINTDGFLFTINNQGTVIPIEETMIILDRFKKLDKNINSLNQGHGLGLSIIKDYVEVLGGSINFESNEQAGTTFSLSLPHIENKEQGIYMEDEDLFLTDDSEFF